MTDRVLPIGRQRHAEATPDPVAVMSRDEVVRLPHWQHSFASQRKDHRHYELVEDTIRQSFDYRCFDYRYFVIRGPAGNIIAIQPFFLLDQDLAAGAGPRTRNLVAAIRRLWPGFLGFRTLMVGCSVGEGHLDGEDDPSRHVCARLLAASLVRHARGLGASLVVLKEFPARDRAALQPFRDRGFTRIPSMPMTRLDIRYADFEDYMRAAMSRGTRLKWHRKLRHAACQPAVIMSVVADATPYIAQIYPLYLQVYERSPLRFEKLTEAYLARIGQTMPDRVRFFLWRQGSRIVAFNLCTIEGDALCSEYVGFDYRIAHEAGLYSCVVRDLVSWGIANGFRWFRSTALNYDPKLHMGAVLDPLDLYVRHANPLINLALRPLLPLFAPTRTEPVLRRFPNYGQLWADAGGTEALPLAEARPDG